MPAEGKDAVKSLNYCIVAAMLLLLVGCARSQDLNPQEHAHTKFPTSGERIGTELAVPTGIKIEHEHLYHEIEAALASGGKTGASARKVADALLPHFEEEESYAMPPLGLMEHLAYKESIDPGQRKQAIQMAEHLRREYAKMLEEHKWLTVALRKLASAAKEENKPGQTAFAEALIVHAQNEEQVLYPAALLVGEYLKLQQSVR